MLVLGDRAAQPLCGAWRLVGGDLPHLLQAGLLALIGLVCFLSLGMFGPFFWHGGGGNDGRNGHGGNGRGGSGEGQPAVCGRADRMVAAFMLVLASHYGDDRVHHSGNEVSLSACPRPRGPSCTAPSLAHLRSPVYKSACHRAPSNTLKTRALSGSCLLQDCSLWCLWEDALGAVGEPDSDEDEAARKAAVHPQHV